MTAPPLRILWIKTELLHPVDKGGRIRTYQMLRALSRQHQLTYLALDDGTAAPDAMERAREYCNTVITVPFAPPQKGRASFHAAAAANLVSSLPYAIARYRVPALTARLRELCAQGNTDVVVCDFLAPSINVPNDLGIPLVLFQHNIEAMIWQRHAQVAGSTVKRMYMTAQWRRMRAFEAAECRRVDSVIAVSPQDAEYFRTEYGVQRSDDVPTGVDTDYFTPGDVALRRDGAMVFVGSMDWLPNEDGICWFAEAILPRIVAAVPHATLTIVGRSPTKRVLALHDPGRGIVVTGSVPDVRPHVASAAVCIVPLRVGGGTRLKIFEGMAMALPTVSTTIGAEGLPVEDGEHLLIGDAPEAFATQCIALLSDTHRARQIGASAHELVRANFSWDGVARRFADLLADVVTSADPSALAAEVRT